MRTIHLQISEGDWERLDLASDSLTFEELVSRITADLTKEAFKKSLKLAKETGLDKLTEKEIEEEVKAVRNAKNRS